MPLYFTLFGWLRFYPTISATLTQGYTQVYSIEVEDLTQDCYLLIRVSWMGRRTLLRIAIKLTAPL